MTLKPISYTRQEQERIFDTYSSMLCVFCLRYVKDQEVAKDQVITAFTKVFARGKVEGGEPELRRYLFQTVKNACFDYLRHQKVEEKRYRQLVEHFGEATETANDEIEGLVWQKLHAALLALPEKSRDILLLLYFNDMTYPEVADCMHISRHSVKSMRKYALSRLRLALGILNPQYSK